MLTHNQYCDKREFFRNMALEAQKELNIEKAEYYTGIIRGLDLAFEDGSAKGV